MQASSGKGPVPDGGSTDDPALAAIERRVRRFMGVALATLGIGVLAVLVAIIYRAVNHAHPAAEVAAPAGLRAFETTVDLPAGSRILGESVSDGQLAVTADDANGSRSLYLFDVQTGRRVGVVHMVVR